MSQPLEIALYGSKKDIALFLESLPIIKDLKNEDDSIFGNIDKYELKVIAHRLKKYNTTDHNSEERKALASEHVIRLHSQSMNCSRIANWLNEHQYKTSRGKRFHSSQVKRLIDESIQLG